MRRLLGLLGWAAAAFLGTTVLTALVFRFVENLVNKEVARDVQNSYPRNMQEAVSP